jgi:hypothetical protein
MKFPRILSTQIRTGQQIYFLHIHKTAGTSLTVILDGYFRPKEVCTAHQWHQLLAIPRNQLSRYRLFRGHFHYCFHTLLPEKPIYITFLRDPIDRAISRYLHLQRDKMHYLYPRVSAMSFAEFLRDPVTRAQVHNLQVRTLAFDFDIDAVVQAVGKPLTARLEMEQHINNIMRDLPDDQLLSVAKQRLATFAFVGITEKFQASLDQLTALFGWSSARMVHLGGPDKPVRKEPLPASIIDELRALNWADIELYNEAVERFNSA